MTILSQHTTPIDHHEAKKEVYFEDLKAKALKLLSSGNPSIQHNFQHPENLLRLHRLEATKKLALLALSIKRPSKTTKKRNQPAPNKSNEQAIKVALQLSDNGLVKLVLHPQQPASTTAHIIQQKLKKNAFNFLSARAKLLKHIPENARKKPSRADIASAWATIQSNNAPKPCAESLYQMASILASKRPPNMPINPSHPHHLRSSILTATNQAITSIHAAAKKAYRDAQIKAQKTRLAALKSDNIEEYMQLVQSTKSEKITRLLSQTDACLRELSRRLSLPAVEVVEVSPPLDHQAQKTNHTATGSGDHTIMNNNNNESAAASPIAALQQSSETWNSLSTAFTSSPLPQQPSLLIAGTLREYQLRGLGWMLSLRNFNLNGILADEMGLGKTIQVIALIAHLLEQYNDSNSNDSNSNDNSGGGDNSNKNTIINGNNNSSAIQNTTTTTATNTNNNQSLFRPFLIAAPASVLPNWEREFATWAPDIHVVSYKGNAEAREDIYYKQLRNNRQKRSGGKAQNRKESVHVVLTTYEYLMGKMDRPRLSSIPWQYIIVDEGHRLKNSACKLNTELSYYNSSHRLLLTGTPVQNSLDELWSLLNFLMPSLFSSSDDFETWFGGSRNNSNNNSNNGNSNNTMNTTTTTTTNNNDTSNDSDDDDDNRMNSQLESLLSEEEVLIVTTRLHQVLRPFMLRRLKDTVAVDLPTKTEHLLYCQPSPYQKALFSAMETRLSMPGGIRGVNNALMELRVICNHPVISKLHAEGMEDSVMPDHPLTSEIRLCGKLELLDRVLLKLKASNHRVLLFCTMTRVLDVLETYLDWRGMSYLRLDGGTSAAERGDLVKQFNAPGSNAFVFLLSVRAGGVGLNLQAADTVIFYDTDWNPQMDAQAAARAHRIGQTRDVLVLRLITRGSVEERIVAVAAEKLDIADRSITGGFFDGRTSNSERQKYLLNLLHQQNSATVRQSDDDTADEVSDEKINELIARNDEEKKVFMEEDRRRMNAEMQAWNKLIVKKSTSSSMNNNRSSISTTIISDNNNNNALMEYSRIARGHEVQPLVAASMELLLPVNEDADKEFGRGKRARSTGVNYKS